MDCKLPASSVHGILQARILEWPSICFSRGFSQPKNWTHISYISCIGRRILYPWAPRKLKMGLSLAFLHSMTSVPDHSLALVSWAPGAELLPQGITEEYVRTPSWLWLHWVGPVQQYARHITEWDYLYIHFKMSYWVCTVYAGDKIKAVSLDWQSSGFPGGASGKEPACQCMRQRLTEN